MIEIETRDNIAIIKISGDMMHETAYFKEFTEDFANKSNFSKIILNFDEGTIICSSIIGVVLHMSKKIDNNIYVIAPKDSQVEKIVKIVNLDKLLKVFDSLDECLASF